MVILTADKPREVVPLQSRAGAPYEPLAERELIQASTDGAWIILAMLGGISRIAVGSIGNIQPLNKDGVLLSFTCQDTTGAAYRGTVTQKHTVFGQMH